MSSTGPGRLDVEWYEELPLPDSDLLDCEVTSSQPDQSGQAPHTFHFSYDAATRTLKDPTYDTEFDVKGRPVQLHYRSNPGAPVTRWLSTIAYDEHGRPSSSEWEGDQTIQFENEYDEQGRVTAVVTKSAGRPSLRDEYRYEDELNPTLWSREERDIDENGTVDFWFERSVEVERQTFTRTNPGGVEGRWIHKFQNKRLVRLEQYGGGFFAGPPTDTPNGRATWEWDNAGTLLRYQSSGAWGSDLSNGMDQFTESYSSGCRELARHFPWLFHLPGPNNVSLRRLGEVI